MRRHSHEASLDHKHRMLEVLCPKWLTYGEGRGYGTPETCSAFNWLPEDCEGIEVMASPAAVLPLAGGKRVASRTAPAPFTVYGSAPRRAA